jgi:hypothetical protein
MSALSYLAKLWPTLGVWSLFSHTPPPPPETFTAATVQVLTRTIRVPERAAPDVDRTLIFTGTIMPATVAPVASYAKKFLDIRRLVIDSGGGDIDAALDFARIVRAHGWDVVVKHRCLSACANYVFVAGARKTVLPNAWVGIHEARQIYRRPDGSLYSVSGNEVDADFFSKKQSEKDKDAVYAREDAISALYTSLHLGRSLFLEFDDYVTRRKRMLGAEDVNAYPPLPGCPRFRFWALNRQQLEQIGVTGIDSFWYPGNEAERNAIHDKNLPPGTIFMGESRELQTYCRGQALNWVQRLLLKHGIMQHWSNRN